MHFCSSTPKFKTKAKRLQASEGTNSSFPNLNFLNFTLALLLLLPRLTRCASHRTPCWLHQALPLWTLWDRWGAGLCRSAWLEIRNAPPPPPPLPPPSLPNGSYQTHQEICDRTILRPWEDCHRLPQRWRTVSTNALHLCALYQCMPECCFYTCWMK